MTTKIEWADEVWNPVTGCTKVSAGCRNCYAERMSKRLRGRFGYDAEDPFGVTLHRDRIDEPFRWRKPRRVFVCSMGDLFHEDVPVALIQQVFTRAKFAPEHTFMVLTKRPRRMLFEMQGFAREGWGEFHECANLHLGVSVEDQATADERIPLLLETPAAVRFCSYEPALGPVHFGPFVNPEECDHIRYTCEEIGCCGMTRLDQIIAGGESGPGARPAHPDWFRSARDQCADAGVAFFFKQWGEWSPYRVPGERSWKDPEGRLYRYGEFHGAGDWREDCMCDQGSAVLARVGKKAAGRELDGRTWDEFPSGGRT